MKSLLCFAVMLLATPALLAADAAKADAARPNIVLIMADDLGYGDVGWLGGPYKTPNLDKLAKESVRLMQHYSLPVCSPTRSSLLSGRFNSRFGCVSPTNNRVFPFDTVTIANGLKSAGYETAIVGKWHLGSKPDWGPNKYGFDHAYGSLAGGVTSYAPHIYKKGEFATTWHRDGELMEEKGHVTDLLTDDAVRFIEKKRSQPFFLYVPYTAVHLPIDETPEWLALYADEKDLGVRQYGACVSHLDGGVGKILAALDKADVRQNTIVLFISDNGGSIGTQNNDTKYAGTHPTFKIPAHNGVLRGSKAQVYEGGIRTPAIIAWPGKLSPRDEQTPVHVADWFPTFAAVAGYNPEKDLKWDGMNVMPMLQSGAAIAPRPLYLLGPGGKLAFRHGDDVLIRQKGSSDELYDLKADISQKKDLAKDRPDRLKELQAMLAEVQKQDNDSKVK